MKCSDRVIWRCKGITLVEVTLVTALQLRLGASQVMQASVNTSQSFPSAWWDRSFDSCMLQCPS